MVTLSRIGLVGIEIYIINPVGLMIECGEGQGGIRDDPCLLAFTVCFTNICSLVLRAFLFYS